MVLHSILQLKHSLDFFAVPCDGHGEGGGGVEEEEDEGVDGRVGDDSHPNHRLD